MYIGNNIYYVMAGQLVHGFDLPILKTTLGSCIAVAAWHSQLKYAAMTHYLLPERTTNKSQKDDGFYGELVLPQLLDCLRFNASIASFQFSAFGGGNFFINDVIEQGIGQRNIQRLKQWEKTHNIKFHRTDLGGTRCRVITLNPETGKIDLVYHQ